MGIRYGVSPTKEVTKTADFGTRSEDVAVRLFDHGSEIFGTDLWEDFGKD